MAFGRKVIRLVDNAIIVCLIIMITSPCNVNPFKPHCYIVKLGFTGVYIIFSFLLKNIDCGYSLKPPQRLTEAVLTCTHNLCFEQKKNITIIHLKNYHSYSREKSQHSAYACMSNVQSSVKLDMIVSSRNALSISLYFQHFLDAGFVKKLYFIILE